MAQVTEISEFPSGTEEPVVKAVQEMRLASGVVESCEYEGSEQDGWKMTTVWNVPG